MIEMLHGKWKGNYSSQRYEEDGIFRPYHEALIMGSFDGSDIEQVIFPDTESIPLAVLTESTNLQTRRAGTNGTNANFDTKTNIPGFEKMLEPQYWIDNEKMSPENAANTVKIINEKRLLRVESHLPQVKGLAAAKIKSQLEQAGIKMTVRNTQGLDYFDPDKWLSGIKAETVEQAIEAKIRTRIMEKIKNAMAEASK